VLDQRLGGCIQLYENECRFILTSIEGGLLSECYKGIEIVTKDH
jgi:hypothetical protein